MSAITTQLTQLSYSKDSMPTNQAVYYIHKDSMSTNYTINHTFLLYTKDSMPTNQAIFYIQKSHTIDT